MALTWNVTKIRQHEVVTTMLHEDGTPVLVYGKKQWHPTTETLVWASLAYGLDAITTKNIGTWLVRQAWFAAATGGEYAFTVEDLVRHIGLTTNVSPLTDREFASRMKERLAERTEGEVARLLADRDALVGQERRWALAECDACTSEATP